MPNLVGIGNSQVPTNAMLGGLAYQDPTHANLTNVEIENIAEIKAKISDEATSVFIYDTSKDSDGGEWRKRTQNASWYNEGPSQDRGSRKEFPAVAVLVAETHKLTIYDGDDPNLSMWMIFRSSGYGQSASNVIQSGSGGSPGNMHIKDIHMLNGQLVVAQYQGSDTYGSPVINFISERAVRMDPNTTEGGRWMGNISQRNTNQEWYEREGYVVANSQMYCCTQFVSPTADLDKDTGLPRPTIFIGCRNSVSQIHSDETVDTDTSPPGSDYACVAMTDVNSKGQVVCLFRNGNGSGNVIVTYMYELKDKVDCNDDGGLKHYYYNNAFGLYPSIRWHPGSEKVCWVDDDKLALSNGVGMNLYLSATADNNATTNPEYRDNSNSGTRTYAFLNKDYPTGYLRRNNPVCTCASIDTDNLVASSNLLSNGTFDSNINGWNDLSGSGSNISWNSGNARMDLNGAVGYARAHTTFTTVVGDWYVVYTKPLSVSPNVFGNNQELNVWVGTAQYPSSGYDHMGKGRYKHNVTDVNEPVTVTFRATQTTTHLVLESGWNVAVDNVYAVRAAEDVSSHNGQLNPGSSSFAINGQQLHKGFVAYNTMGRTPAASGSEIVTYDMSSNGYLEQPYNHQLNFLQTSSNSYTVMAWGAVNETSSGWKPLISRDHWNGSKQWYCGVHNRMALHGGVLGNTDIEANQLYFFCWVRNGSTGTNYVYLNGRLDGTNTDGATAAANQTLIIGARHANGAISTVPGGGTVDGNHWTKVALVRISAGYTDATMINQIYNEERKLFMPNAKCTLDNDQNYLRGISSDKDTGLLHALSTNTRNDFDGLVRINSETRSSAGVEGHRTISSVNGMIVEEE